jgi:hypothetical protein
MYAVVYPAKGSPKNIGPPEDVPVPAGPEEKGLLVKGEVGDDIDWYEDGGRVSQERVRKHDCRIMEKEEGESGSCVEV